MGPTDRLRPTLPRICEETLSVATITVAVSVGAAVSTISVVSVGISGPLAVVVGTIGSGVSSISVGVSAISIGVGTISAIGVGVGTIEVGIGISAGASGNLGLLLLGGISGPLAVITVAISVGT